MHYNTRRKSISLQALGIQVPQVSRAHRPSLSKSSNDHDSQQTHPAKRLKRAHTSSTSSPDSPIECPQSAVSTTSKTVTFADRPKSSGRHVYDDTPPPSPGASGHSRIDMQSVHDDIVAGVIEQLEKTGNRPHLIKELASVLSTRNPDVNRYVLESYSRDLFANLALALPTLLLYSPHASQLTCAGSGPATLRVQLRKS